jgi:hypothetical protein
MNIHPPSAVFYEHGSKLYLPVLSIHWICRMRVKDGRECLRVGRGQGGESLGVVYNYYYLDMLCTDVYKNKSLHFYVFQNTLI